LCFKDKKRFSVLSRNSLDFFSIFAAGGVKLRALCAFCGGEAETAQTEYTHETFICLMSPITKGENKGTVRLDLFFKKGEAHFIPTLFAYVMNNILGDRFKKAVPDSLDRELEGEDGSMALGASLAGEENTEREVLGEMMTAAPSHPDKPFRACVGGAASLKAFCSPSGPRSACVQRRKARPGRLARVLRAKKTQSARCWAR